MQTSREGCLERVFVSVWLSRARLLQGGRAAVRPIYSKKQLCEDNIGGEKGIREVSLPLLRRS